MNANILKDESYFKMVAEHQQLAERVLRLHDLLNLHPCIAKMPTEACTLINEMKCIVETGVTPPENLLSEAFNFDELPFIDAETKSCAE